MLTPAKTLSGTQSMHISAQINDSVKEKSSPQLTVLWDVLRTLETQLQKRGILPTLGQNSFSPLWFIAETERNTFLWRKGRSLIDKDQFEFWINVPKLVAKRLAQMEEHQGSPHLGLKASWESTYEHGDESARNEREYLLALVEIMDQIGDHAYGLSKIGSEVRTEVLGALERVYLPV